MSKKSISFQQLVESSSKNTIYLKSGVFKISETLQVPSGVTLKGNKTTLQFDKNLKLPLINIHNAVGSGLDGIKIIGPKLNNKISKAEREKINFEYLIQVNQSKDINISNCIISQYPGTVIDLRDSKRVNVTKSTFQDIGVTTDFGTNYSYDAIFIGGYTECANITVSNCTFKNIGTQFPRHDPDWPSDGDGIQIQSLKAGQTNNIRILGNKFINCAMRGVKVQTGNGVLIKNNIFQNCGSAVQLAMAKPVKDVVIDKNTLKKCRLSFGTDCLSTKVVAHNLTISNNKVDTCYHFFRTSGESEVSNCEIINNEVGKAGTYFIEGRFVNSKVTGNKVGAYGTANDKTYNMGIYVWPASNNLTIENNTLTKSKLAAEGIRNIAKGQVKIGKNEIKEFVKPRKEKK